MPYSTFDFDVADHVATLRFNRPEKANAMVMALWKELPLCFAEISRRPEVRAVLIASTGKHFTGGLDLSAFAALLPELSEGDRGRTGEKLRRLVLEMQESINVVERCRVPVLAAVQGGCIGGGVDLVTACDLRYATQDAYFVVQEINIGMTADVGTLQRLPRLIPEGVARELCYTGRKLSAERAYALGLVNELFPTHEALLAGAREVAKEIAKKSPLAIVGSKEMLTYARDHSVEDGLRYIAAWQAGMFLTADLMEQLGANMEKRPAKFDDLFAPFEL